MSWQRKRASTDADLECVTDLMRRCVSKLHRRRLELDSGGEERYDELTTLVCAVQHQQCRQSGSNRMRFDTSACVQGKSASLHMDRAVQSHSDGAGGDWHVHSNSVLIL